MVLRSGVRRSGVWGTAAAVVALSVRAWAQDPVQMTVTVTGTLDPVPFQSLARVVDVVSREQIAAMPVRSVADVLQVVAGLDVRSRGPAGVQSDFSVRGSGFEQVLVLINGVRAKNAQTGHHNGDIPVSLDDIERIEVLRGAGSSLHGADAFGGTINIVTRKAGPGASASAALGGDGFVEGAGRAGVGTGRLRQSVALWGNRSSGFMADRDFRTWGMSAATAIGPRTDVFVSHVSKAFGANGFYGPAPSYEWTNETLALVERHLSVRRGWTPSVDAAYLTHGDEFLYDLRQPTGFRSQHRTHAVTGSAKAARAVRPTARLTVGGTIAEDWIRSNTLGDHAITHGALFAELQQFVGPKFVVYPGLRVDGYSTFGAAWSPSLSAAAVLSPAIKLRGSAGRAFRIPSFTERFYQDPNNIGTPTLEPERAWSVEAGVDLTPGRIWSGSVTGFARLERGVIDWVRPDANVPWRSTNVRHLVASGLEVSVRRSLGASGRLEARYALTSVDSDGINGLSKYVLDFPRHIVGMSGWIALPGRLTAAPRVEFKQRNDGRQYWLVDARVSRPWSRLVVFIEGSNLLDVAYQEVRGVDMPGRWLKTGISLPRF